MVFMKISFFGLETETLDSKPRVMKKTKILLFSAMFLTVSMFSCSKYEEGPALSLRSKKERIANTWKIEKAYRSGQDVTEDYDQYLLTMGKDGDASLLATYTSGAFTFQFQTNGTWKFENSKEVLVLDFEDDDADAKYQILRLKEDELWLREQGGEDELHLIPN